MARNFWKYLPCEDLIEASWKLSEKTNQDALILIGNFDLEKNAVTPFFFSALGFSEYDTYNENVLRYKKHNKNLIATKDKKFWEKYIEARYLQYIPSYIKTT